MSMTKTELETKTAACIAETHYALELIWGNINKGQRKQLYKDPEIKALLDRYGVEADV